MKNEESFQFFESKLADLIRDHRGQFVIVKDGAFHGFFLSMEEALKTGYSKFGTSDFLIQEITDEKRVNLINGNH